MKLQSQMFVCNEADTGLGFSEGGWGAFAGGYQTSLPTPAHIFADVSLDAAVLACHCDSNLFQLPPVEMLPLILGEPEHPTVAVDAL